MPGTVAPSPWFTGLDDNGVTLVGGKLYTYAAGTSQPEMTFTDVGLQIANSNPIVLDGGGRATVFLGPKSYKFVLKDENDVTIRTQDNIAANAAFNADVDIAGIAGENLFAGAVAYLSVGAETPTPGIAGRWYLATASVAEKSTGAQMLSMVQTDTLAGTIGAFRLQGRTIISTGPIPLQPGKVYYVSPIPGQIVTPAPGLARVVGIADSLNSLVSATGFGAGFVVSGDSNITGNLTVGGSGTFGGDLFTSGNFLAQGNINAIYAATVRNVGGGSAAAGWVVEAGTNTLNGLYAFNQIYVPAPGDAHNKPNGVTLYAGGIGGLSIYSSAGLRLFTGGVFVGGVFPSGGWSVGPNVTGPGAGTLAVSSGVLINRTESFPPQPGHLQIKAASSVGWDGLHIQLDQDVVNAKFLQFFNAAGGSQGSITQPNASTTAYNTTSDMRLKRDLGIPLETRVLPGLIVHDFQWTADGTVSRGVFAQEAATVLPMAVTPGCEGPVVDEPWQVDYSKVVPDLIVGWQAHERRIISLLERLERLESRHDG